MEKWLTVSQAATVLLTYLFPLSSFLDTLASWHSCQVLSGMFSPTDPSKKYWRCLFLDRLPLKEGGWAVGW